MTIAAMAAYDFPKALRLWRKRSGLTQEEIAVRVGVHRDTYGRWELGKAAPHDAQLGALRDLGFKDTLAVSEPKTPYDTQAGVLSILVDTLYDCEAPADRRALARREIYRLLHLSDDRKDGTP